jgi:hypothetical protein
MNKKKGYAKNCECEKYVEGTICAPCHFQIINLFCRVELSEEHE